MMRVKRNLIWLFILWPVVIAASFLWNYSTTISNNRKVVLNKSQAFFEQILASREWNAGHGGVYVRITPSTQPNPYLQDSLKIIETKSGIKFTKINPAFMTRQISEINTTKFDIRFHITSRKPIRPANAPDPWESRALCSFETGRKEVLELVKMESGAQYRYMAPLITNKNCLACHAKQGYKTGDIRGGISISFPAALYLSVMDDQLISFGIIHFIVLITGLAGLLVIYLNSRKYYQTLDAKNAELSRLNATKDKFFSIIAHDLRSPFNSILGFSQILTREVEELDSKTIVHYAGIIHASAQRSFLLVDNLLDWARMQQGQISFNPEELDVSEFVSTEIEHSGENAQLKNIEITMDIAEGITISADKNMARAILRNLLGNAIKFTPEGGKIHVASAIQHHFVEISVSDSGVGMTGDDMKKLFRIETSFTNYGTENEKGSGLGLLLCQEFTQKHGGTIRVQSTVGKGSTFRFTLPAGRII